MRIIITIAILSLPLLSPAQSRIITGIVKDLETKEPLAFCDILALNTTQGSVTDIQGKFAIELSTGLINPKLIISYVGYEKDTISIEDAKNDSYIIYLKNEPGALNSVIVTGVSKATLIRENPLTMETISPKQIDQAMENNVIDALTKNAPGFQAVKTGPNVSKPFINGLGYNRVLTLYDGMRVETQQWGDEHGVPLDDYLIERAEVIEGPASLMYGSDAIAGVLSLFPAIPHDTDRMVHGRVISEYQTNNGLIGNGLRLSYSLPHWSFAIGGSERIAKNYTNPIDGRIYNTGFNMDNGSAFIGYHGDKGYSHLSCTIYDNRQGIPDGSRDSMTRNFTYQIYESAGENTVKPLVDNIKDRPIVPTNLLTSYYISPLSQRIQDYRAYSDNFYDVGRGTIKAFLGGEENIRREFNHPTAPSQAGEYIVLNTLDYAVRYNVPSFINIESSLGANGMYQNNISRNATDFPIPDYNLIDIGAYGYAKWKHKRWTIAGGVRYDHRNENGQGMYTKNNPATGFYEQVPISDSIGSVRQFSPFRLVFQGVSGSIGTTFQISRNLSMKANFARGYRSPNITEIASNGLDPGAHIVYEGNLSFVPEYSLQEDIGLNGEFKDVSFGVSAFNNNIQHYIYQDIKVDKNGNPIVIVPGNRTFQFQQTNAQLVGGHAILNIHPEKLKGFSINNAFSLVYAFNRNPIYRSAGVNGEYLPFIPPPRLLSGISYNFSTKTKIIPTVSLKADVDYNMAQNRYLGLYGTETPTAQYVLLNAFVHTGIRYTKKQMMQVEIGINNILNTAYQSHLSRLQYFEYYTQSPNGHLGIYNMGRNVCMKVIFPF
jgi:iron complex outermembrane receptor protein